MKTLCPSGEWAKNGKNDSSCTKCNDRLNFYRCYGTYQVSVKAHIWSSWAITSNQSYQSNIPMWHFIDIFHCTCFRAPNVSPVSHKSSHILIWSLVNVHNFKTFHRCVSYVPSGSCRPRQVKLLLPLLTTLITMHAGVK